MKNASSTIAGLIAAAILTGCAGTQVDQRAVAQLSGADLYQRLCSSCHGEDARGNGPVTPFLKLDVPDLTRLAYRDGGEFPAEDVRRVIDGRWDRRAHGTREMPIWGWQLYDLSSTDGAGERSKVDSLVDRLVNYLASVQQP